MSRVPLAVEDLSEQSLEDTRIMAKKAVIIGLLLLGTGASVFAWVFSEQSKEEALYEEYRQKWEEDLASVDRLIAGETDVQPGISIADNEPSQETQKELRARMEDLEMAMTASIVCMLSGGTVLSVSVLWGLGKLAVSIWGWLGELTRRIMRREDSKGAEETENAAVVELEVTESEEQEHEKREQKGKRFSAIRNILQHNATKQSANWKKAEESYGDDFFSNKYKCEADDTSLVQLTQNIRRTTFSEPREDTQELEDSLRVQGEALERQIQEIKQMTQNVQQATAEQAEPLNTTLMDLTQQVAAIRDYTTQQQERVKKLQEGYDWNIIRTFCLRVIRCIDNIESRVLRQSGKQSASSDLEEVKDELIFALESSGVEQFEPEVNSEYRGQEKWAEAVKEKVGCDDPGLKGRIAEVLRPGYQYVIAEDNIKVVRTAQVKLWDVDEQIK